jgi:hypothetical protein
MPCAIPPLDMRYARVVGADSYGLDLVAFGADRQPAVAPVVASLQGRVRRWPMTAQGYLNNVILELEDGRFLCYSGLAFNGRASEGAVVPRGAVIGQIEPAARTSFLRSRLRTASVDPYTTPFCYVEAWSRLPPVFVTGRSTSGTIYRPEAGFISPSEFWGSLGIDIVGPRGSQLMAIRRGGPSDCGSA